jgi:hypothetical protein
MEKGRRIAGLLVLNDRSRVPQKSMPPIPPIPPPAPPGMAEPCFFGSSATIASVVISRPATEAAPCSVCRVDDALRDQIAILASLRVIAEGVGVLFQDLTDDD